MATQADVVAITNNQRDRLAIWHVAINPSYPMSRLCGAWVNVLVPFLYVDRLLMPFEGHLTEDLATLEPDAAGIFDPNGTRDNVVARIAELDARHKNSPTKAGNPRAPIPWPRVPETLDWANLPEPPHGVADDPLTRATICVARWVSDLSDAWSSVEVHRLARRHLADGEVAPRPMPVVLTRGVAA